jgi:hypothetical protein
MAADGRAQPAFAHDCAREQLSLKARKRPLRKEGYEYPDKRNVH